MAEQIDLRSALSLLRRRRMVLVLFAVVGALMGVALVTWHPPLYASSSQVLLPATTDSTTGESTTWDAPTQVSIAESDAVLGPAAKAVSPALSRREVHDLVAVRAPTDTVLVIEARGKTGEAAAALAEAVAEAEVAYQTEVTSSVSAVQLQTLRERRAALQATRDTVNRQVARTHDRVAEEEPDSPIGRRDASTEAQLIAQQTDLTLEISQLDTKIDGASGTSGATIIEHASPADRPNLLLWYVVAGAGLALLTVLMAILVMVNLARRDAKLGTRDEIADATGGEVVASLRSQVPRTVAAWRQLLESYTPSVAEGWALRTALSHVGLGDVAMGRPDESVADRAPERHLLCVVSLADDARALSMGPQIASYAASIGISTLLVPEQGDATAALWAACSSQPADEPIRPGLRIGSRRRTKNPAELTVLVSVLDRTSPRMPRLDRSAVVLLAVSSRSASAEDLARTAVAAFESRLRIAGTVVADPDPLDRTTGRLLLHERLQQPPLPSRDSGPKPTALRDTGRTGGAS